MEHLESKMLQEQFTKMCATGKLFRSKVTGDQLWNAYITRHYAYRFPLPLDFQLMNEAAKHLFDYQDFTSFYEDTLRRHELCWAQ